MSNQTLTLTITGNSLAELRTNLAKAAAELSLPPNFVPESQVNHPDADPGPEPIVDEAAATAEPEKAPEPAATPSVATEAEAPSCTLDDIRAASRSYGKEHGIQAVRDVLAQFDVKNVSKLAEKDYAQALRAFGGAA
jgi:hypothetical protein